MIAKPPILGEQGGPRVRPQHWGWGLVAGPVRSSARIARWRAGAVQCVPPPELRAGGPEPPGAFLPQDWGLGGKDPDQKAFEVNMRPIKMDFLLAGVGGQGVLTASDIVCEVGLAVGYDAKKSEVHGFSQRGGIVDSHVRWGEKVYAPLAEKGAVDVLLAFELLEAARWLSFLKPGGLVIANRQKLTPMSIMTSNAVYPSEEALMAALHQASERVLLVDGLGKAEELGSTRLVNTVLLGALSAQLEIAPAVWLSVIERRVPPKYVELNRTAFWAGRGQA